MTLALAHAVKDPLVPSNERGRLPQWIIAARRGENGGEPRRLILGQVGSGLPEMMPFV